MNPYTNDQEALPVPGVHPSDSPTVTITVNETWIPYIVGALETFKSPSYWAGTPEEVEEAVQQSHDLLGLFGEAV